MKQLQASEKEQTGLLHLILSDTRDPTWQTDAVILYSASFLQDLNVARDHGHHSVEQFVEILFSFHLEHILTEITSEERAMGFFVFFSLTHVESVDSRLTSLRYTTIWYTGLHGQLSTFSKAFMACPNYNGPSLRS